MSGHVTGTGHQRRAVAVRALVVALASLVGVGVATPASADPAGPTHYDSRLTGVEAGDGSDASDLPVRFEVLGGDAFLVARVEPGSTLEVPGYEDEPYVRIAADGTVEVNARSPSRWLNDARYGAAEVDVPADADVEAPPRWETVGTDGEYAWHDHRIHWMSPALPRQVDPQAGTPQPVAEWTVPVRVDGRPVAVTGELRWLPGPAPALPLALVGFAVVAGAALALRRVAGVAPVVVAVGTLTLLLGASKNLGLPTGADGEPFLVVLPLLALAVVGTGLAVVRRDAPPALRGQLIAAAGGIPLLVWAVVQAGALTRPIVPGPLPVGLVRGLVAAAIAAGVAGLVAGARTVLAATSLEHAERPSSG